MSPFHDLGQRCGGPRRAARARNAPSYGPPPSAVGRAVLVVACQDLSLPRFAWLLTLGVLGLAGLLSLGVGGVALLQGYLFRA